MRSINQVMLAGHVGRIPKVSQTSSGKEVAEFSLATNRPVRDGEGWASVAEWHQIIVYEHNARLAAQFIHKGDFLVLMGELRHETWEDRLGQKRITTRVLARTLCLPGGRGKADNLSDYASPTETSPVDAPPAPSGPEPLLPDEVELPF